MPAIPDPVSLERAALEAVSRASAFELTLVLSAALVVLNAAWSGVGVAVERSGFGRAHRVWSLPLEPGQIGREVRASLAFNVIAGAVIALLLKSGAIRFTPSDAGSVALTFGACWVSFEVYYWGLHRALHTRRLYRFHKWHHESRVTTAFSGFSVGPVEAVGWAIGFALAPVALSLQGGASAPGFALYLLYNYSGNIVGHVNAEFLPRFLGRTASSWMMHPITYHALHHARFRNHYGFGSTFMDRLLRTEWSDWPLLFARVREGLPLSDFGQRGRAGKESAS